MSNGELIYRIFLGFYGLVFPAYVWICMIGSSERTPDRNRLIAFAVAVMLALPFFYLGFIQGWMIWLLPGLAIVLLARVAVLTRSRTDSAG